jgi:hypothetical protein
MKLSSLEGAKEIPRYSRRGKNARTNDPLATIHYLLNLNGPATKKR